MIKFLSSWIEEIAVAVIIASIFEMLLPKGNLKKYIKVVLGIYIVFNIISPFVDSEALYSFNISDTIEEYVDNVTNSETISNSSVNSNESIEEMYMETLKKQIISDVEEQGYNVESCDIDANFDTSENDIGIKKINIVLSKMYNEAKESDEIDETEENSNNIEEIEEIEKIEINVDDDNEKSTSSSKRVTQSNIIQIKKYLSENYEIDRSIININVE